METNNTLDDLLQKVNLVFNELNNKISNLTLENSNLNTLKGKRNHNLLKK